MRRELLLLSLNVLLVACAPKPPPCASAPCENGGTCINDGTAYVCLCAPGFSGSTCQTQDDACAAKPCFNGGTCAAQVNGFTCTCRAGFSGVQCETNVDDCASLPCQNGGTCVDDVGGFRCACRTGFTGTRCETNVDDCTPNRCFNGGTCTDQVGAFSCACRAGFTGVQCETNVDECASRPCQNGGVCVDGVNGFSCACAPGFSGARCDTNVDDCPPGRCFNGGVCMDGVNTFTCACPAGHSGALCEAAIPALAITSPSTLNSAIVGRPYRAALTLDGGIGRNVWTVEDGGTNVGWLSLEPSTGELSGTPTAAVLGPVAATLRVADRYYPTNFARQAVTFSVITQPADPLDATFDGTCPTSWTLTGDWQCGEPTVVGPATAFSGTQCLGTQLAGNYGDLQTFLGSTATSPPIALSSVLTPQLTFRAWIDTEGSTYDGFSLAVSTDNGATFDTLTTVTPPYPLMIAGQPAWGGRQAALGWQAFSANISRYAGQTILLRFQFRSDSSNTFPGVYIDDVRVTY